MKAPTQKNQGNYLELIRFLATYKDKVAEVVLENAQHNAKYTSPKIQKEICIFLQLKCEMLFAKK
jgi:ubiquinone biosynthesis protein COQ9